MGEYIANRVVKCMIKKDVPVKNAEVLVLGFTFKENCPDVRNTKVIDIYKALKEYNLDITVYDPWANPEIVRHEYGVDVENELHIEKYDAAIMAVAHSLFEGMNVLSLLKEQHVVFDVKGVLEKDMIDSRL